jgi:hypothetical protein
MIYLLIILALLLTIAMLCRSLVHTLLHHYLLFDNKFNADDFWWMPSESWMNKYKIHWTIDLFSWRVAKFPIPVQASDAFHLFNTIELGAYDMMISLLLVLYLGLAWWWFFIVFLIIGVVLMPLIFNLGYNKLWS